MKTDEERLKILVETVVRPLVASGSRKDKIREELLAHLKEDFASQTRDGHDPTVSLERVRKRFGDPLALRREIQQSVPWWERILCVRLPLLTPGERWLNSLLMPRPGETAFAHSARITAGLTSAISVFCFAVLLHFLVLGAGGTFSLLNPDPKFLLGARLTLAMLTDLAVNLFFLIWIGHGVMRLTQSRPVPVKNKLKGWGLCLLSIVPACAGILAFPLFDVGIFTLSKSPLMGIYLAGMPMAVSFFVAQLVREQRRREWEDLVLSD